MLNKRLIDDYLDYLTNIKERSKNTISNYKIDLNLFFDFLSEQNVESIKKVDLNMLYKFLAFCNNRGDSGATRARRVATLKSFFKYLYKKVKLIDYNPTRELEMPKQGKRNPHYLNLNEAKRLLKVIDGNHKIRDYAIITLFLNCGLRLSELVSINIDDIKEDKMTIKGKGNKERTIYLNNACLEAIKNYLKVRPDTDNRALFLSQAKKRISNSTIQKMVKHYLKKAKLDTDKLSVHSLRHSAAFLTLKYGENVDIRTLQELLGHSNISTTQIYAHIDNEQIRRAVNSNPLNIK